MVAIGQEQPPVPVEQRIGDDIVAFDLPPCIKDFSKMAGSGKAAIVRVYPDT